MRCADDSGRAGERTHGQSLFPLFPAPPFEPSHRLSLPDQSHSSAFFLESLFDEFRRRGSVECDVVRTVEEKKRKEVR